MPVVGSVASGDDADDSDIAVLVDFDADVSLVVVTGFGCELSKLLDRSSDVVPARGLKPEVARRVLEEAVPL